MKAELYTEKFLNITDRESGIKRFTQLIDLNVEVSKDMELSRGEVKQLIKLIAETL